MRCANRSCKNTRHLNPTNLLCPTCDKTTNHYQRRQSVSERQSLARALAHNSQRELNVSFSSEASLPVTSVETNNSLETLVNSNASNIAPNMTSQDSREIHNQV